jgi:hypothetical protein
MKEYVAKQVIEVVSGLNVDVIKPQPLLWTSICCKDFSFSDVKYEALIGLYHNEAMTTCFRTGASGVSEMSKDLRGWVYFHLFRVERSSKSAFIL